MAGRRGRGAGGGGHDGGGEERWLLPYSDMITLLLGLFIVLFAMSTIDAKQFDNVKRSLAQTFHGAVLDQSGGVLPGSNGVLNPTAPSQARTDSVVTIDEATRTAQRQFDRETKELQRIQRDLKLGNDVKVTRTELGIQISIAGDALFASGSYQLTTPGIKDQLTQIQRELKRFGHPIRIEGHTDGQPCSCTFGNEGLSAMRALSVQAFFASLGYPAARMHIAAYGDQDPKVKPEHPQDAVAANRRIEIIVLEPGADSGTIPNVAADSTRPAKALQRRGAEQVASDPAGAAVDAQLAKEFDDALVHEIATTGQAVG